MAAWARAARRNRSVAFFRLQPCWGWSLAFFVSGLFVFQCLLNKIVLVPWKFLGSKKEVGNRLQLFCLFLELLQQRFLTPRTSSTLFACMVMIWR